MIVNKIGRNSLCPCGSGLKYKKCCLNKSIKNSYEDVKERYLRNYNIRLKSKKDIEGIKEAGKLAIECLRLVEENLYVGMKTIEINDLVHNFTIRNGAICAPLGYKGFPKSVCVSVNSVICHGIPGDEILKDGDIVNVDVTPILNGYYADANKTFFIGEPNKEAKKIVDVARECLKIGMEAVKENAMLNDIGKQIEKYAKGQNCSVVREFVGHGVGFDFHEAPQVVHFASDVNDIKLVENMVFTIEPMINLGKKDVIIKEDNWTAVTKDGSLSAQFEQTLLVTKNGFESLTPYDF